MVNTTATEILGMQSPLRQSGWCDEKYDRASEKKKKASNRKNRC